MSVDLVVVVVVATMMIVGPLVKSRLQTKHREIVTEKKRDNMKEKEDDGRESAR